MTALLGYLNLEAFILLSSGPVWGHGALPPGIFLRFRLLKLNVRVILAVTINCICMSSFCGGDYCCYGDIVDRMLMD